MSHKNIRFIGCFAMLVILLGNTQSILSKLPYRAPSAKNTVIFFDLDGVVSDETISYLNFLSARGLVASHLTLPLEYFAIVKKSKEMCGQPIDGAANMIHAMMKWLEDEKKYTNMVEWTRLLTEAYVCPAPKSEVLDILKELKKKGFTVLFATNQDSIQFEIYRKKMLEKGYNLEELFDGGVSTLAYDRKEACALEHNKQHVWHAVPYIKPQQNYYEAIKKLALEVKPECKKKQCRFIFIDDKKQNTDAAKKRGIRSLHFTSAAQLKKDLDDCGIKV